MDVSYLIVYQIGIESKCVHLGNVHSLALACIWIRYQFGILSDYIELLFQYLERL